MADSAPAREVGHSLVENLKNTPRTNHYSSIDARLHYLFIEEARKVEVSVRRTCFWYGNMAACIRRDFEAATREHGHRTGMAESPDPIESQSFVPDAYVWRIFSLLTLAAHG